MRVKNPKLDHVARSTRHFDATKAQRHEPTPYKAIADSKTISTAFQHYTTLAFPIIAMPPGRPHGRPAKNSTPVPQQRLSFGPKNAANKITKPSAAQSQLQTKKLSPKQKAAISDSATLPSKASISPSPETPNDEDPIIKDPKDTGNGEDEEAEQDSKNVHLPIRSGGEGDLANANKVGPKDLKEAEATKVSEAQIKKYWKQKEEDRIAPRVHQKGLSVHEKVLREFDLSSQYGVSFLLFLEPPLPPGVFRPGLLFRDERIFFIGFLWGMDRGIVFLICQR